MNKTQELITDSFTIDHAKRTVEALYRKTYKILDDKTYEPNDYVKFCNLKGRLENLLKQVTEVSDYINHIDDLKPLPGGELLQAMVDYKVKAVSTDGKLEVVEIKSEQLLTEEKLKDMVPGQFIAGGKEKNSPSGIFMSNERIGEELTWVAKRGDGYHDWAIYCHWANEGRSTNWIAQHGQKVGDMENVKTLMNCHNSALKLYRR